MGVVGEFFEEEEEAFHGLDFAVAGEAAADEVDFVEGVVGEEEFFAAGAGTKDVDGGVDEVFGEFAVEDEFHVSGAFEFLEDGVVGFGVGVDEGGAEDGEGAGFAGVASGGEESAGHFEGAGHDAAGLDAAAAGLAFVSAHLVVVGSGEAGDGVHEEEDVLSALDESFGAFDAEFGEAAMVAGRFVVGGGVDFGVGALALELGDFLGSFVDEADHEVEGFLVEFLDGFGDVEEEGGFAGARRGDDESALAATDGGEDVDDAGGEAVGGGFEADAFAWEDGFEFFEVGMVAGFVDGEVVEGVDGDELRSAVALLGFALDELAGAKGGGLNEVGGDEDVFAGLFVVAFSDAEEAEAFGGAFEEASDVEGVAGEFAGLAGIVVAIAVVVSLAVSVPATVVTFAVAIAVTVVVAVVAASTDATAFDATHGAAFVVGGDVFGVFVFDTNGGFGRGFGVLSGLFHVVRDREDFPRRLFWGGPFFRSSGFFGRGSVVVVGGNLGGFVGHNFSWGFC